MYAISIWADADTEYWGYRRISDLPRGVVWDNPFAGQPHTAGGRGIGSLLRTMVEDEMGSWDDVRAALREAESVDGGVRPTVDPVGPSEPTR